MTINNYLQMFSGHRHVVRPRVKCRDGYTVSVQAGEGLYSCPRREAGYYTEVELGYPSDVDMELLPYAEDPDFPTQTVYGYVPVEFVDAVLNKHGGILGPDYSNTDRKEWEY